MTEDIQIDEALPEEFGVFPLTGALLLPHGKLPLNIFEPRYLRLVEDALASGRIFGMIQPEPGGAEGTNGPALFRIGCLGRLSSFSETEDGRYLITLTGLCRFAVRDELDMRQGYRRVRAELAPYLRDLDPTEGREAFDRIALVEALRSYFSTRGFSANWQAIEQMPDDALVTTLSMVCPFEPVEKQALLEAGTPGDRAASLLALLQMGSHGTAYGTSFS